MCVSFGGGVGEEVRRSARSPLRRRSAIPLIEWQTETFSQGPPSPRGRVGRASDRRATPRLSRLARARSAPPRLQTRRAGGLAGPPPPITRGVPGPRGTLPQVQSGEGSHRSPDSCPPRRKHTRDLPRPYRSNDGVPHWLPLTPFYHGRGISSRVVWMRRRAGNVSSTPAYTINIPSRHLLPR